MARFIYVILSYLLISQANAELKSYRTFLTVQKYILEQAGKNSSSISNVRLTLQFANGSKVTLPETNQYFPIGNGQTQEINRTFEIPKEWITQDGLKFVLQIERKGAYYLPCMFNVVQIPQENRSYTCRTDVQYQLDHHLAPNEIDKQGVQIRIFTDINTPVKEIPENPIQLGK